jgi:hypothetical protein
MRLRQPLRRLRSVLDRWSLLTKPVKARQTRLKVLKTISKA